VQGCGARIKERHVQIMGKVWLLRKSQVRDVEVLPQGMQILQ